MREMWHAVAQGHGQPIESRLHPALTYHHSSAVGTWAPSRFPVLAEKPLPF
jgi:hypothetical protein